MTAPGAAPSDTAPSGAARAGAAQPGLRGTQSMVAPLERVLLMSPEAVGWGDAARGGSWRGLGYARPPAADAARREHAALQATLSEAGAELVALPGSADLSLDAVYTHDASLATEHGIVVLRMGKPARSAEPERHAAFYRSTGIPILGEIHEPGTAEGGDLVWLDRKTLLAGRGYRTNAGGIAQLGALLGLLGVEVVPAPLPHADGPEACLHLMSIMSMLDDDCALVDAARMAVETMELLRARGLRLIPIEPAERPTLACNVLALGNKRLLAYEENPVTIGRLRAEGFDVRAIPGSELGGNGGGGPTCLTRPLRRAPVT